MHTLINLVVEEYTHSPEVSPRFIVEVEEKLVPLTTDCDLLREIVRNLIGNAVKYNRNNEPVIIRAFHKRAGDEVYGRRFAEDRTVIVVADKGIGIPVSEQSKVFEQFFRATNAQAAIPNGTGLGLYLVLRIVGKMNGEIWFSSREGEGTEFYLALPYGVKAP